MKSLKWKIVILYILLFAVVMTVSGVYLLISAYRSETNEVAEENAYLANRLIDTMQQAEYTDETPAEFFRELMAAWRLQSAGIETAADEKSFYLLDADCRTLYCLSDDLSPEERASETLLAASLGESSKKIEVQTGADGERIAEWAQVFSLNGERYILLICRSMDPLYRSLRSSGMSILIATGIGILIAGIFGYLIARGITRPLNKLTQRTKEMAAGRLAGELITEDASGSRPEEDEMDSLNNNFNDMAGALSAIITELNNEKDKLNLIFQYMTDGLVLYAPDGSPRQWNPAAEALMGEKVGKNSFENLFRPWKLYQIEESTEPTSQLSQVGSNHINAVFVPLKDNESRFAGVIAVLQDVTERTRVDELQKEFVANVSHELRTPITTVKSYVETMLETPDMPKETEAQFLEVVQHEADRMAGLIQELLTLSRIDSQRMASDLKPLSLPEAVYASIRENNIHAVKKNQELRYLGSEKVPKISGNSGQIAQVLRNLIINAITYSPENTKIEIETAYRAEEKCVELTVRDHGIGIASKDQARIFERFYRADKARSRALGGTGLGLAIVKEIMDMHGGSVSVDSTVGKGSTFTLSFPALKQSEAADTAKSGEADDEA